MRPISRTTTRRFFLRALTAALSLMAGGFLQPAFAIVPLVQDYLHGVEVLKSLATIPADQQGRYRQQHAEDLQAAVHAVETADDIFRYTLAMNIAVIYKYGHPVICNYDQVTGPHLPELIENHIARLVKFNVPINQAREATGEMSVSQLVLGEMMEEFGCPPEALTAHRLSP